VVPHIDKDTAHVNLRKHSNKQEETNL
jgi:hypothetical protein